MILSKYVATSSVRQLHDETIGLPGFRACGFLAGDKI